MLCRGFRWEAHQPYVRQRLCTGPLVTMSLVHFRLALHVVGYDSSEGFMSPQSQRGRSRTYFIKLRGRAPSLSHRCMNVCQSPTTTFCSRSGSVALPAYHPRVVRCGGGGSVTTAPDALRVRRVLRRVPCRSRRCCGCSSRSCRLYVINEITFSTSVCSVPLWFTYT